MGKSAVLFVNIYKKNATAAAEKIKNELENRGVETTVFSFEKKPCNPPVRKWDIAFSLGGDGTVLYTARNLAPLGVPILPVNLGTLGFIAEVDMADWLSVFHKWEKGEIIISRRCMLDISIERDSQIIMKTSCLNDAVISYTGIAKLIRLDVALESMTNNIASETALGSYRCDALIIATPTGSTAYSMAAGGPILDPEMEAVILTPVCPFTLANRPFVLTLRQTIKVTVPQGQRTDVLLTIDGQDTFPLKPTDRLIIKQAPDPVLLLFAGKSAYYSALRNKLFWSGGVHA